MAKFHGKVGYADTVETAPGVYQEEIVERVYYGDITRTSRSLREGEQVVNPSLSLGNSISIVSDAYARERFFAIRYVEWEGVRWSVANVDVQHPRLLLNLGEVFNGLEARTPDSP